MDDFLTIYGTTPWVGPEHIMAALLMSFVLASAVATVYRWTFQSLSYSRSFIHTLVLSSMIVTFVTMAIGDNLARGLGVLGTLALVRYRTPVRDPRDMTFLFACMGIGIACGATAFGVATVGTGTICLVALLLHVSPFASRREQEALLRFVLPPGSSADGPVKDIMRQFCTDFSLIALREEAQGELVEHCYQVRLVDPSYQADLVEALGRVPGLSEPSLLLQRTTVEL